MRGRWKCGDYNKFVKFVIIVGEGRVGVWEFRKLCIIMNLYFLKCLLVNFNKEIMFIFKLDFVCYWIWNL